MCKTVLSIPLDFSQVGMTCQQVVDMIGEEFSDPDRKSIVGPNYLMEWDYDEDCQDDAEGHRDDLISSLEEENIELDKEEPTYSGIQVYVIASDGTIIVKPADDED